MVDETAWERVDGGVKWAVVTVGGGGGNDIDNTEQMWLEQGRTVMGGGRLDQAIQKKARVVGETLG